MATMPIPPPNHPRGGACPPVSPPPLRLRPWPSLPFGSPLLRCSPPFAPPARACCVAAPGCSSSRAPCLFASVAFAPTPAAVLASVAIPPSRFASVSALRPFGCLRPRRKRISGKEMLPLPTRSVHLRCPKRPRPGVIALTLRQYAHVADHFCRLEDFCGHLTILRLLTVAHLSRRGFRIERPPTRGLQAGRGDNNVMPTA